MPFIRKKATYREKKSETNSEGGRPTVHSLNPPLMERPLYVTRAQAAESCTPPIVLRSRLTALSALYKFRVAINTFLLPSLVEIPRAKN